VERVYALYQISDGKGLGGASERGKGRGHVNPPTFQSLVETINILDHRAI